MVADTVLHAIFIEVFYKAISILSTHFYHNEALTSTTFNRKNYYYWRIMIKKYWRFPWGVRNTTLFFLWHSHQPLSRKLTLVNYGSLLCAYVYGMCVCVYSPRCGCRGQSLASDPASQLAAFQIYSCLALRSLLYWFLKWCMESVSTTFSSKSFLFLVALKLKKYFLKSMTSVWSFQLCPWVPVCHVSNNLSLSALYIPLSIFCCYHVFSGPSVFQYH